MNGLPGFYYDEERRRYFRVVPHGNGQGDNSQGNYTRSAIKKRDKKESKGEELSQMEILSQKFFKDCMQDESVDDALTFKWLLYTPLLPSLRYRLEALKFQNVVDSQFQDYIKDFKDKVVFQSFGGCCARIEIPILNLDINGFLRSGKLWYFFCRQYRALGVTEFESADVQSKFEDLLKKRESPFINAGFSFHSVPTSVAYLPECHSLRLGVVEPYSAYVHRWYEADPLNPSFERRFQVIDSSSERDPSFAFESSVNSPLHIVTNIGLEVATAANYPIRYFSIAADDGEVLAYVVKVGQRFQLSMVDPPDGFSGKLFTSEPTAFGQDGHYLCFGFRSGSIHVYHMKSLLFKNISFDFSPCSQLKLGAYVCGLNIIRGPGGYKYLLASGLKNILRLYSISYNANHSLTISQMIDYKGYSNDHIVGRNFKFPGSKNFFAAQSSEDDHVMLKLYYLFYERPLEWGPDGKGFDLGEEDINPAFFCYEITDDYLCILDSVSRSLVLFY